jgi:hypothetical protein
MALSQINILVFAIFLLICGCDDIVAAKADGKSESDHPSLRQRLSPPVKVSSSFSTKAVKSEQMPQRPSWWLAYRKQMRSHQPKLKTCDFLKGVIPATGDRCTPKKRNDDGFMCMFGEQQCESNEYSGETHPETKCECQSDGKWNCEAWNPCDNKDITTEIVETKNLGRSYEVEGDVIPFLPPPGCPPEPPLFDQTCSEKMECSYGTEKCCGEEHPSMM